MPDEIILVPLPANDWQTVIAGLLELPAKFCNPVLGRLQAALAEAQKPREVVELKEVSDGE